MDLLPLKKEKSAKLLMLEAAKKEQRTKDIFHLGSDAATFEGRIAEAYLDMGEHQKAIVNIISQASCLCDSKRFLEAHKVFKRALSLRPSDDVKRWIEGELSRLPPCDLRESPFSSIQPNIDNNDLLRIPQKEAYFAAKSYFKNKKGHAIIQLPVGCGKTGAMAIIPFGISGGRILVIAPNLEIRRNLQKNLDYFNPSSFLKRFHVLSNGRGPTCSFLDSDANIHDCDAADIVVTNIQQLATRSSKSWLTMLAPNFFDTILIDEAHHNVAETWQTAIDQFPKANIVSFTATPLRSDGKKVEGERIYRFPIAQAIRDGYIKDIASRTLEPQEIFFTFRGEEKKATLEEVIKLRENEWFSKGVALSRECNENIVDASIQSMYELRESGETHQIIAVACSIDHANSIKALYTERQLRAEVLHSNLQEDQQEAIRRKLQEKSIDAIVQIQMLGEGADYPHLSVAAIFRPYRHLMPYVQFVGRVMRVVKQNSPGHPANRGYVVSHIGLNVDRWWKELKEFDRDDESFFEELANGSHDFLLSNEIENDPAPLRRRFKPEMDVIEEAIVHFIQDHFVPEDAKVVIDDLIQSMSMRGIDFEALGLNRETLEERLIKSLIEAKKKGTLNRFPVSPQESRKAARQRLHQRVNSAAKQLLNELGLKIGGFDLPKHFPSTGTSANLPAAIVLLNKEVLEYLKTGPDERDILNENQLRAAHDNMDEIIDNLANKIREKMKGG